MDDAWEQTYFMTLNRNGTGDFDSDGMTDLEEFLGGTNPTLASSSLRLRILSTGPTVLRFDAAANKAYTVEFKNNFNAAWTFMQSFPTGAARTVQMTDPSVGTTNRFYRVRTP